MLAAAVTYVPYPSWLNTGDNTWQIVAATFVSVIDDARRFKNAHAVGAYLGLVPSETTSGGPDKRRLGSITKQGNRMARAMLIQSAWTILRLRDTSDPLKRWAEGVAKARNKRIAVVALARKLAGVLWAMWRDGTECEWLPANTSAGQMPWSAQPANCVVSPRCWLRRSPPSVERLRRRSPCRSRSSLRRAPRAR